MSPEPYALLVEDDAMAPRALQGQLLLVEPVRPAVGDLAVVQLHDSERGSLREVTQIDSSAIGAPGMVGLFRRRPSLLEFVPVEDIACIERARVLE